MTKIPVSAVITPTIFARKVEGTWSPYPTVDMVTTHHQNASIMELKGESGSASLAKKTKLLNSTTHVVSRTTSSVNSDAPVFRAYPSANKPSNLRLILNILARRSTRSSLVTLRIMRASIEPWGLL